MPSFLSYRLAQSRPQENWHKLSVSCTSQANHLTTTHCKGELPFLGSEAFLRGHRHPTRWAFHFDHRGTILKGDLYFARALPTAFDYSVLNDAAELLADRHSYSPKPPGRCIAVLWLSEEPSLAYFVLPFVKRLHLAKRFHKTNTPL
jgi:hypothetical protein